jgi:acetyltransferase-like isoleucine patch superfamily enzyme
MTKIRLGKNSIFLLPLSVGGQKYITVKENVFIGKFTWLQAFDNYCGKSYNPQIIIESDVSIGNFASITAIDKIVIGKGCLISEHFYVSDHGHGFDPSKGPLIKQDLYSKGPVIIGENTFIGYRTSILPGVTLGKHCVVGCNSVVTKSFPDYSMIGGIPARLLKTYDAASGEWLSVYDKTV